jgi:ABC-2 type transport system ATP-binding protein
MHPVDAVVGMGCPLGRVGSDRWTCLPPGRSGGSVIISTHGLTKRYGSTVALDAVDLGIPEGAVFGLVGANGAGKTTLLSILAGLRRPTSGCVLTDVQRQDIGVCADQPEFEPWLTALEVLDLAATMQGQVMGRAVLLELLDEAGLGPQADRRVGEFSRGMTQRLALASTVVARPRLVILDEPCSALDPIGRTEVLDLVTRVAGSATVVLSSHVLADVERVCDHLAVLDRGRVVTQGPLRALLDVNLLPAWRIRVRDRSDQVVERLHSEPWVAVAEQRGPTELRVVATDRFSAERRLAPTLASLDLELVAIEPEEPRLEDVFLALTTNR